MLDLSVLAGCSIDRDLHRKKKKVWPCVYLKPRIIKPVLILFVSPYLTHRKKKKHCPCISSKCHQQKISPGSLFALVHKSWALLFQTTWGQQCLILLRLNLIPMKLNRSNPVRQDGVSCQTECITSGVSTECDWNLRATAPRNLCISAVQVKTVLQAW